MSISSIIPDSFQKNPKIYFVSLLGLKAQLQSINNYITINYMAFINENYLKLKAGYLFPEIGRRVREFAAANPGRDIIRMGIGDVTQPLTPAILKAFHEGVEAVS